MAFRFPVPAGWLCNESRASPAEAKGGLGAWSLPAGKAVEVGTSRRQDRVLGKHVGNAIMDEVTGFAACANKGGHVAPFLGNLKSNRHGGVEGTAEHREEFRGNHGEGIRRGQEKAPGARRRAGGE